ncbi:polysaccharide deacetylase family protein [Glaciecola petra]|uniref:Polysaccharide deacetylase family protein n=1 Tax=Glaciecola petra TaxID=3075602 RepID=A0ABU2ZVI0_9ALTE|nr:polysaccharide deacetylase family protein [Aestuariibacter sp. P117]MDT0596654.1 polysaccharide deacetylase family protein [Aestuariibacter sp. P117]
MSFTLVRFFLIQAFKCIFLLVTISLLWSCSLQAQQSPIYLTYDDGPDPQYTLALLDVLAQHNVKATFFVTGQQAKKHPEIVLKAFHAGHTIANHSYAHRNAKDMSYDEIAKSYEETNSVIRAITGQKSILFRAPFLSISEDSQAFLCKTSSNSVGVDMSGKDWATQKPDEIMKNLFGDLNNININGGVILLHDGGSGLSGTRQGTIEATQRLIPLLKNQGFTFADNPPLHKMQIADSECEIKS